MWRTLTVVWINTLAFCCGMYVSEVSSLNLRPIIGILAQEANFGNGLLEKAYVSPDDVNRPAKLGDTYVPGIYVKWLESAGARVAPIRIKESLEYYENIFNSINGVIFPGGSVDIQTSEFARAAEILYEMAIEANDEGHYFPLWGTCKGLEILTKLTSGQDLLASVDAENLPLSLDFSKGFRHSRLFDHLPEDIFQTLATQNIALNNHQFALTTQNFSKNADLKKFYQVLSTNKDRNGLEFISTLEAFRYPIYAIQWHPEKNNYAWDPEYNIDHTTAGIKVSQYFADFFVSEARKSSHHFKDTEEEIKALIDNYHPLFSKNTLFIEDYFFNYT